MRKLEKIYYVSQYDGDVHNIHDVDHIITNDGKSAEVGVWVIDCGDTADVLRVDEEVDLFSILEIAEFYKDELLYEKNK